jgi:hypothetical protein
MKKVIFALAAVVALAACSQEDVIVADKGAAIGFDTFVENSTRVTQSADPSLTVDAMKQGEGFGVYGFVTNVTDETNNTTATAPLFTDKQVKWTNGVWKYEGTQYWIDGATYDFAAIAPYGAYDVTEAAPAGVTLDFTNTGETDLLYAQNNGISGTNHPTVGFTFKHLLSKVKFTFTNGYDATNTLIAVKNIVINDTSAEGTAELGVNADKAVTATWTLKDANLDLAFGDAVTGGYIAQGASEQSAKSLLIIPAAKTYSVTFTVELYYKNGENNYTLVDTYSHDVPFAANFEFGKSYNLATTITYKNIDPDVTEQHPIEFTVTAIEDWGNGNTADDATDKDSESTTLK